MHFCGDIFHDLLINAFTILIFYPIWLPFGMKVRSWVLSKSTVHTNHGGKHS